MAKRVLAAVAAGCVLATSGQLEAAGSFDDAAAFQVADFTFRTVRPPKPGSRKSVVLPQVTNTPAPPRPVVSTSYDWFWNSASTLAAAADPGRFLALGVQFADRLQPGWGGFGDADRARAFAVDHQEAIAGAAMREKLSPAFLLAVIAVESAGQTKAKSPKGAQGLMQLMPATAKRFEVADPYDATQNIAGGAAYLNFLLETFGDDPLLALAGYNAGEGAVEKYKGVPPYDETRAYVPKVLGAFMKMRQLCTVPPVSVRAPCAFFAES